MRNKFFIGFMLLALTVLLTGVVSADDYIFRITEADHVVDEAYNWYMDLSIPQISGMKDQKSQDEQNAYFLEWRDFIIDEYNQDAEEFLEEFEEDELPRFGIEYNWEVIVDTEDYFVFRTTMFYAAGSSMSVNEYWTLNKHSGELLEILDVADKTRLEEVRGMILDTMKKENETRDIFWTDEADYFQTFSHIEEFQHWYVNEAGNLVITFDKYEIAPGSMGEVKFEILENEAVLMKSDKYTFYLYVGDTIQEETDNWYLDIRIPVIGGMADPAEENELNQHFEMFAKGVQDEYKTSVAIAEDEPEGADTHFGYEYFYQILAETDDLFSFETVAYFGAGSSMTALEFWTLDKNTGKQVKWEDVVSPDEEQAIYEQIVADMNTANEAGEGLYYTDDETVNYAFSLVPGYNHWYLNADGDLVIAFNKYEVAVGAQGTPEFVIKR